MEAEDGGGVVEGTGLDGAILGGTVGGVETDAIESGLDRFGTIKAVEAGLAPGSSVGIVCSRGSDVAVIGLALEATVVVLGSRGGSRARHRGCQRQTLDGTRTLEDVGGYVDILKAKVVGELEGGLEGGDRVGALALNLEHESGSLEGVAEGVRQRAGHVDGRREADGAARREGQIKELGSGVGTEKLLLHDDDEERLDGEVGMRRVS